LLAHKNQHHERDKTHVVGAESGADIDLLSEGEAGSDIVPESLILSSRPLATPRPSLLANILRDFNSTDESEEQESSDVMANFDSDESNIDREADDEKGDEEEVDDEVTSSRKARKRYTEIDFDFFDVEWLEITSESSEDDNSDSSNDIISQNSDTD
jgi:hypothetical protein